MDRRALLGTLAGSLFTAPITVEAQQSKRPLRIGYLDTFTQDVHWNSFLLGLREQGYVVGQNLHIERRS